MIFLIKGNQELFHACIQQLSDEQKEALSNALSNGWPSTNISCYPRLQNFIVVCGKTKSLCDPAWMICFAFNIAEDQGFHKTFRIQSYKLTLCNCYGCCACVRMRERGRKRRGREKPMNTAWAWANQRSDFLLPMECKLTKLGISTDFKTHF